MQAILYRHQYVNSMVLLDVAMYLCKFMPTLKPEVPRVVFTIMD